MAATNNNDAESLEKQAQKVGVRFFLPTISSFTGDQRGALIPLRSAQHLQAEGFAIFALGQFAMEETDPEMYGIPDPATFTQLPWKPEVAWMSCNVYHKGAPLAQCPRTRLQALMEEARVQHGVVMKSGIEPEIILLDKAKHDVAFPEEVDLHHYHDPHVTMDRSSFMMRVTDIMEQLGWEPYEAEKEAMACQYEFSFKYADALTTADRHSFMKFMLKEIGKQEGYRVTFMPAPFPNKYMGSGMHQNVSLWSASDNQNIFEGSGRLGLSKVGEQFLAGIMKHADALCALVCPSVNSYKRLVGSMAMPTVSYGKDTRFPMIRIPAPYNRIEYRIPDGSVNPYVLQAATLAAGLDGIKNNLELDPKEELKDGSVSSISGSGKAPEGIRILPLTLKDALDALEEDTALHEVLGKDLVQGFLRMKREQWKQYCKVVTDWETQIADDY